MTCQQAPSGSRTCPPRLAQGNIFVVQRYQHDRYDEVSIF